LFLGIRRERGDDGVGDLSRVGEIRVVRIRIVVAGGPVQVFVVVGAQRVRRVNLDGDGG
jgi:hypothetical protein